jgi:hypothetical protein
VASSRSTTGTPLYVLRTAAIREHFPEAELVEPSREFDSIGDWLRRRRAVLRSVGTVVFFEDRHGFIGRGVVGDLEIADALQLPIWFLSRHGTFTAFDNVRVDIDPDGQWDEYGGVYVPSEPC